MSFAAGDTLVGTSTQMGQTRPGGTSVHGSMEVGEVNQSGRGRGDFSKEVLSCENEPLTT